MAEKDLLSGEWKKFAKGRELDDAGLLKALSAVERARKGTPAAWTDALDDVQRQVAALRKTTRTLKSDRDLVEKLSDIEAEVAAQRRAAAEAARKAEEDEDTAETPDILTSKMVPLLRQVHKGTTLHALIALAGKDTALLLARRSIAPARRKLLTDRLGTTGGVKFVKAECLFEAKAYTFVVTGAPAAGLAKRLKAALLAQVELRLKVRVRGESPDDIDEDLEGDDGSDLEFRGRLQDAAAEVREGTQAAAEEMAQRMREASEETAAAIARATARPADPEVLKALVVRFQATKAELDRVKALDTPIGGDVRQRLAAVTEALRERRVEGVGKQIDQLDQIARAVAARAGGGAAVKQAVEGKAASERLALLKAELLALDVASTPVAGDVQARLSTVEADLAAGRTADLARQLDALAQIVAALKARRSGGGEAAKAGARRAYEQARAALAAAIAAAQDVVGKRRAELPDAVAEAFERVLKAVDDRAQAEAWREAEEGLPAVSEAAEAVQDQAARAQAVQKRLGELRALIADATSKCAGVADGPMLPLAEALQDAREAFDEFVADRDWDQALDWLESMGRRSQRVLALHGELLRVETVMKRLQPEMVEAIRLIDAHPERIPAALIDQMKRSTTGLEPAMNRNPFDADACIAVLEQIGQLARQVKQVQTRWAAYQAELASGLDDIMAIQGLENSALFPDKTLDAFNAARQLHHDKAEAKDWAGAQAAIQSCKTTAATAMGVLRAGAAYYNAAGTHRAVIEAANAVRFDPADRLAVPGLRYREEEKAMQADVQAGRWTAARDRLPALAAAAQALVDAHDAIKDLRAQFEREWTGLATLAQARQLASRPPAGLDTVALERFRLVHTKANDARNAGDYGTAQAQLEPLKAAITALLDAERTRAADQAKVDAALLRIAGLAQARALAAGKPSMLTAACATFTAADEAVRNAVAAGRFDVALSACPALEEAAQALAAARLKADTGVDDSVFEGLTRRLDGLKSRIEALMKVLDVDCTKAAKQQVAAADKAARDALALKALVQAELAVAAVEPLLDRAEAMLARQKTHIGVYVAARNGAVKVARDTRLSSPTLHKLRDNALDAQDRRIQGHGNAGRFDEADREVQAWVAQAQAWVQAKAAYWTLLKNTGGSPDASTLSALAGLPGGGAVLDALMAELPEDKPQAFVKEAMKARYGFEVKQFKKKNPDRLSDLSGLTAVAETLPDKSLKALYGMLGEVPLAHIKGKVNELVRFTEEEGGAAYGSTGKKVYMYCGRTDDPKATKQTFGEDGGVLPAGEAVEEACEPVDKDPVPYFKFAALHEVGHAEDDAGGHMLRLKGIAGWQKHRVEDVARLAAGHLKYDEAYVLAMLRAKGSKPPATPADKPDGVSGPDWEAARLKAVEWCRAVREDAALWNHGSRSKERAIDGRVYHEAYEGDWVSYDLSARAQGITGYQFRAPGEWFAELYAAYYCKKLKPNHPAMAWLTAL